MQRWVRVTMSRRFEFTLSDCTYRPFRRNLKSEYESLERALRRKLKSEYAALGEGDDESKIRVHSVRLYLPTFSQKPEKRV